MKAIELINVSKSFQDGDQMIEALKPTNFSVSDGEFVAIVGPSGSGKSTFLTLSGGLQSPSQGEIRVKGQAFSSLKEKDRAKRRFQEIGFILQASNLISYLTVQDQLRLVDKIQGHSQAAYAQNLFQELGVDHLLNKYPADLSGGERQRVAIARALYPDPTIILADEPTASLDSQRAFEVVNILARESKEKNKAIIMVTHDTRLINQCDRVFEMRDGVLEESH
ncbi:MULTISPECIES: ABC transporter ATP-binding protein [Aerococcus]|uniref:ABC transporter ATP-binding protein n=1 Tax=Aerococcus TaxID=1375 RepID=UPI000DCAFD44|nr:MULTISPECIES: ABC transporter ATP-binding protein [Aerococcus]KAA9297946.1 ABC transporter ATP-binding protein [Aerococcus tenax]MDK6689430.1 ABC transporter ATP-binding protein [Aerococcus urinae]MDK8133387.1 ABC transporter ATP-binding protein [Aerococcus urinae]MDK8484902.1 ABC transporter ATP-binding protein [Aerococcus urinae]MDL5178987.1 ABC transporter ATP-binding protein [Aerococcus tenax]